MDIHMARFQQPCSMSASVSCSRIPSTYHRLQQFGKGCGQHSFSTRQRREASTLWKISRSSLSAEHLFVPSALASQDPEVTNVPATWRDVPDSEDMGINEPFNHVGDVMTEVGVKATTPDATLESIVPLLDNVTGLPVVDEDNKVVGVITRKDILRAREKGLQLSTEVWRVMSTPPVTVRGNAHVGEAAAVMLARKVHRLPVVDKDQRLVGIVSRTDIMTPLLHPTSDLYKWAAGQMEENPPLSTQLKEVESKLEDPNWQAKYLYDGDCPVCASVKAFLQNADGGKGRIKFVDISDGDYDPAANKNIEYEEAMEDIHAIKRDGTVIKGYAALQLLYEVVGLGWVMRLAALPGVAWLVEKLYSSVSGNRHKLGDLMKPLLAANVAVSVMHMEEDGGTGCGKKKEECEAPDW
eukprot:jgi/Botrbrau1/6155/Bobra.331_2s0045.1